MIRIHISSVFQVSNSNTMNLCLTPITYQYVAKQMTNQTHATGVATLIISHINKTGQAVTPLNHSGIFISAIPPFH